MAFAGGNRPLPGRGPSPGFRFTLYAVFAVVLMYFDLRGGWLEQARYGLSAAAYPIQLAVNSPSAAWRWIRTNFETRASLQAENARLRSEGRLQSVRTMRYEAVVRENALLRGLREALPPVADRWMPAEVINVELSTLRQRLLIDKGAQNGVFRGQAVLARGGLLGQVMRVGPWTSEVILITDPEHAIPVQVVRSGLRTLAVGQGTTGALSLPYLPLNSDIQKDDLLVTSGLGGVFPEGYSVARVDEVGRDPGQPLAQVRASPLGAIEQDRVVTLVWFRPNHPAAPANLEEKATAATSGGPMAVPPRRGPTALPPAPPPPVVLGADGATLPGAPAASGTTPAPMNPVAAPRAPAPAPTPARPPAPTTEEPSE